MVEFSPCAVIVRILGIMSVDCWIVGKNSGSKLKNKGMFRVGGSRISGRGGLS